MDAREEAIKKIKELLGEHFTAYVLIVQQEEDDDHTSTHLIWNGGFNTALGIVRRADIRLAKEAEIADFGDPPDDSEAWKEA